MNVPDAEPFNVRGADYLPTAELAALRRRAELLAEVRRFFHARGFWEVETPLLSADVVVDRHLDPLCVRDNSLRGGALYLQTSPEFAMKRLLAAGAERIFQIARAFRDGERGPLHNPEFTMVEWYCVGQSYRESMTQLGQLAGETLGAPAPPVQTYGELFQEFAGVDPHRASLAELQAAAARTAAPAPDFGADRDGWLNWLLGEQVEPALRGRCVIVCDYPASQAALARVSEESGVPVARRFELYVNAVELANGYWELLDASELARRQQDNNRQRREAGKEELPERNRLLAAMRAGLPDCCGVALGFDRLVMAATGAPSIDHVMAFPFERA